MKQVHELWNKILTEGEERPDRTGVGTLSIFGGQVCFDLRQRFPLVTLKKTLFMSAFTEMLWFLRGENNTSYLKEHGIPIWDDWADAEGNLGPIYGVQWRKWLGEVVSFPQLNMGTPWSPGFNEYLAEHPEIGKLIQTGSYLGTFGTGEIDEEGRPVMRDFYQESFDQIKLLIEGIKKNPNGRRHIVTAWNPAFLSKMGLPPCHRDFQCYVTNDGHLDLMMAIRSWDTALGGPFNIAQYALLTHLIARATGLKARHLKINYGDAHLYLNHVEKIHDVITLRQPIECDTQLVINTDNTDIDGYKPSDFDITGYECHPFVKLPIAV